MARIEQEGGGFKERVGTYALYGGIVAGLIGLVSSWVLVVGGAATAAGGYYLRKSGK